MVDRHRVFIGSMNLDPRSQNINGEMGVVIESSSLGAELAEVMERDMGPENAWRVRLNPAGDIRWEALDKVLKRQPARSFWQGIQDVVFMAFPRALYWPSARPFYFKASGFFAFRRWYLWILRPQNIREVTGMNLSMGKAIVALLLIGTFLALPAKAANTCTVEAIVHEANVENIEDFVAGRHAEVLTFQGYSGSEYEDPVAMLEDAGRILDAQNPTSILVNIGATEVGIGAVYELAKRKGFATMGIVSTLARDEGAALSPCVDHVFFVKDSTWGGRLPEKDELSPTSQAIVDNSTFFVAIGGGNVARDELLAARRAGKPMTFIPADMNHAKARAKARKRNLPEPTDFRGSVHTIFGVRSQSAR